MSLSVLLRWWRWRWWWLFLLLLMMMNNPPKLERHFIFRPENGEQERPPQHQYQSTACNAHNIAKFPGDRTSPYRARECDLPKRRESRPGGGVRRNSPNHHNNGRPRQRGGAGSGEAKQFRPIRGVCVCVCMCVCRSIASYAPTG